MNKKKILIPVIASILTLVILTGVSYAYFSAKITENNKTETIMKSNELGLTFTGVSEINASSMIPGDSCTKTFSVENTSNRAVDFNVYMQNITNEFNEDLVYTLSDEEGVVVSEKALPVTNTGKSYLKTNVEIDAGVTKNYTLKIEYKYLDTPQNDYQGSSFKATLGIDTEDALGRYTISGLIEDENGIVTSGTVVSYSEKQITSISNDGLIKISNLEMGNHEIYYMGDIDAANLSKDEIQSQSICSKVISLKSNDNIEFDCINDKKLILKNISIVKRKPISFAEDDWDTISEAVKFGKYPYNVSDTKTIDMGDFGTHTVRVANTSECTNGETSETACGFVVEFADIITWHGMNSYNTSVGGWPASAMRTYVNETVYNALPSDLQGVISDTTVVSGHESGGSKNYTSIDKLYLLSTKEVWGKEGTSTTIKRDTAEKETRQLDYYKNLGVTTSNYGGAKKQSNGSNYTYWLRSADSGDAYNFFTVYDNGVWNYSGAYSSKGVSPAFRIV